MRYASAPDVGQPATKDCKKVESVVKMVCSFLQDPHLLADHPRQRPLTILAILNSPLSHASRTQATVTLSSAEAELMGMAEALHLRQLIEVQNGLGLTTFSCDHKTASLASRLGVNRRSRHISLHLCGYKTYDNKEK